MGSVVGWMLIVLGSSVLGVMYVEGIVLGLSHVISFVLGFFVTDSEEREKDCIIADIVDKWSGVTGFIGGVSGTLLSVAPVSGVCGEAWLITFALMGWYHVKKYGLRIGRSLSAQVFCLAWRLVWGCFSLSEAITQNRQPWLALRAF